MAGKNRKRKNNPLVYSTESGKIREEKKEDEPALSPESVTVYLRREVKGRRGKTVTTVSGLEPYPAQMVSLAGEMKKLCGTGGTVKEGQIIIQGDQQERLSDFLNSKGFSVKISGG